jgi:hypothetical protein
VTFERGGMAVITESFRDKLYSWIKGRHVDTEDFLLSFEQKYKNVKTLVIEFRFDTRIQFIFNCNNEGVPYEAIFTPGSMLIKETRKVSSLEEISELIQIWVNNIDEELLAKPVVRTIHQHSAAIDSFQEHIDKLEGLNVEFTIQESNDIKKKLDELEEKLEKKIEEDNDMEKEHIEIIRGLKKDILTLKLQSDNLTKKNWFLSFTAKMYKMSQKYPKVTRLLGVTVFSYLPEEITSHIPEESMKLLLPNAEEKGRID